MHCLQAALILLVAAAPAEFSGASALEYTRRIVGFGPRPPGSQALEKTRRYIVSELRGRASEVVEDSFTAATPAGPIRMRNIVGRFRGGSGRAVVVSGHYDTKLLPGIRFVGANDGGASAGFLLEMARVLAGRALKDDVYLVWFDGEEAIGPWSDTDGLYGSRHLAARWERDGTLGHIRALINVDMIGDRDLGILREAGSAPWLVRLLWQAAADLGYGRHFLEVTAGVEDDHMPFVRRGVHAVNLIDFNYGPPESTWWHTEADTLDKLSPRSFEVVGRVILETLRRLGALG